MYEEWKLTEAFVLCVSTYSHAKERHSNEGFRANQIKVLTNCWWLYSFYTAWDSIMSLALLT